MYKKWCTVLPGIFVQDAEENQISVRRWWSQLCPTASECLVCVPEGSHSHEYLIDVIEDSSDESLKEEEAPWVE